MPARVPRIKRQCHQCHRTIFTTATRLAIGCGKYCSLACQRAGWRRRKHVTCETCGVTKEVTRGAPTRFCSKACIRLTRVPIEQRFWRYVTPLSAKQCWLWSGSLTTHGYGQISDPGNHTRQLAPRLSYRIHYGQIPVGQCVRHKCDTPACVNPAHLELGTKYDNSQDMAQRGRSKHGEQHWNARLTAPLVQQLRQLHATGMTYQALSRQFGVHQVTIAQAVKRETWKHIQ